jgi:hypothetical protein
VVLLERRYWFGGGGYVVLLRPSMGGGGCSSKIARERPLVDVPKRHGPSTKYQKMSFFVASEEKTISGVLK